ncbi:MAG TPA: lipid A biosynthesis acyltransferase [Burkholderiales bacterium]|nr:lipid A biosynthesis acyltransferase [Burkholderiales bacterium]
MIVRIGVALVWLLHFLPLRVLAKLGEWTGVLLLRLGHERREVARTNLRLCFPQLSEERREYILRRHFRAFGRNLLEHGILWWSSRERIKKLVRIEGLENWQAAKDKPVIWLAPHFVGLDMGGSRLHAEFSGISMYSQQKHSLVNALLLHGRTRFGGSILVSRHEGIRPVIKALHDGVPFYYLPDMDYGPRESLFVPFFGVPAATIPTLSRLARITGAKVVPCVTRQLQGGEGYVLKFYPAWDHFPGASIEDDTRRMNAFIEQRVLEMPEQYFWLHKRFKTRPQGESKPY